MLDCILTPETTTTAPTGTADQSVVRAKTHKGMRNHLSGPAAEDAVLRAYVEAGYKLLARRYRAANGEIDLIFRDGPGYVFVEVKASQTFDRAMARITPAQIKRIYNAASVFVGTMPEGQMADMRFDAALVNHVGALDIRAGVLLPY